MDGAVVGLESLVTTVKTAVSAGEGNFGFALTAEVSCGVSELLTGGGCTSLDSFFDGSDLEERSWSDAEGSPIIDGLEQTYSCSIRCESFGSCFEFPGAVTAYAICLDVSNP